MIYNHENFKHIFHSAELVGVSKMHLIAFSINIV